MEPEETQHKVSFKELEEVRKRVRDGWNKLKETQEASCLYADIYDKLYYDDNFGWSEIQIHLRKADDAEKANDIDALQKIFDGLHDSKKVRHLNWYKEEIQKSLQCDLHEIFSILSEIKTAEVAEVVLVAIQSSDHLPSLQKGYAVAKKLKHQRRRKEYRPDTYEHGVRRNRRMLEANLRDIGIGVNKARKISQILLSI